MRRVRSHTRGLPAAPNFFRYGTTLTAPAARAPEYSAPGRCKRRPASPAPPPMPRGTSRATFPISPCRAQQLHSSIHAQQQMPTSQMPQHQCRSTNAAAKCRSSGAATYHSRRRAGADALAPLLGCDDVCRFGGYDFSPGMSSRLAGEGCPRVPPRARKIGRVAANVDRGLDDEVRGLVVVILYAFAVKNSL